MAHESDSEVADVIVIVGDVQINLEARMRVAAIVGVAAIPAVKCGYEEGMLRQWPVEGAVVLIERVAAA